jgi:hypothetical protein
MKAFNPPVTFDWYTVLCCVRSFAAGLGSLAASRVPSALGQNFDAAPSRSIFANTANKWGQQIALLRLA